MRRQAIYGEGADIEKLQDKYGSNGLGLQDDLGLLLQVPATSVECRETAHRVSSRLADSDYLHFQYPIDISCVDLLLFKCSLMGPA